MARVIGRNTKIGLGKETVRGTAVAPSFWIPVLEYDFDDRIEMKDNESGYGNLVAVSDSQIVKKWADGTYSGKIFDRSVGLELTGVFGQSPTSVQRTTTGVYDHTYTLLQSNVHQSFTTAIAEDNYSGRHPLTLFDTWELESEVGDYVQRNTSLTSKSSASSSETVAYTDENEFVAKDVSVKLAAANASDGTLDAASVVPVRSVNFAINKNAEGLQVLGSNDLSDVVNKKVEISGEFEMYYDNRTYHTIAAAGTKQSLRIELLNSSLIIGTSGSHNPALRFQFSNVALEFPERGNDLNDVSTLSIPFKAMLSISTGSALTARLTNAYAGTAY